MATVNELVNKIRYEVDNSGLSQMWAAINAVRESIKGVGTSIQEGWVLGVQDAVAEQKKLIDGTGNLAVQAEKTTAAVHETTAAVHETTDAVTQTGKEAGKAVTAVNKVTDATKKGADAATKGVQKTADATKKLEGGLRNVANYIKTLVLGVGVIGSARIADEWAGTNARIELAVDPSEVKDALKEIYDIANRAGQEYNSTGDLFSKIARNQKELAIGTTQSLALTEIISKAMTIGGGSQAAQSAALTQLGQALGSGVLRGDELNSIIEQSPRLALAIAEAFGVTVGKLKDLGSQGKLTSKELATGLLKQAEKIDAEFEKMPKTFARGITLIKNAYGLFINDLNRASRASEIFYALTKMIADNLNTIVKIGAFAALSYAMSKAGGVATALFTKIRTGGAGMLVPFLKMATLLGGILLIGEDLVVWAEGGQSVFGRLVGPITNWKTEIEAVQAALEWVKRLVGDVDKSTREFLLKWGAIALIGNALVRGVFLFGRGLVLLLGPVRTLLSIFGTIATVLAAVIGWPATIAVAVVAVAAIIYSQFDAVKKYVDGIIDSITNYFSKKWTEAITSIRDLAKKFLPDSWFDTSGLSLEQRQQNDLNARAGAALEGSGAAGAAQLETSGGAYVGAGRRGGRSQVNNINNNVNVTTSTDQPAAVGNAAANAVGRATGDAVQRAGTFMLPTVEAGQ